MSLSGGVKRRSCVDVSVLACPADPVRWVRLKTGVGLVHTSRSLPTYLDRARAATRQGDRGIKYVCFGSLQALINARSVLSRQS
jgi:hypothetical protein